MSRQGLGVGAAVCVAIERLGARNWTPSVSVIERAVRAIERIACTLSRALRVITSAARFVARAVARVEPPMWSAKGALSRHTQPVQLLGHVAILGPIGSVVIGKSLLRQRTCVSLS